MPSGNMYLVTIVLSSLLKVASSERCGYRNIDRGSNYIMGGLQAKPNEFPWMVSLQMNFFDQWQHFCGGSIINEKWILTAAHCMASELTEPMQVVAGAFFWAGMTPFTQVRNVSRSLVHWAWDIQGVQNDIALIELDRPLIFNPRRVFPICLPTTEQIYAFDNATCVATGWGKTHPRDPEISAPELLKVDLSMVPLHECQESYKNVMQFPMSDTKICAGRDQDGFGVCPGDSGGPLACKLDGKYFLTGISSFGYRCGSRTHPPVFTRVAALRDWIDNNINY